MPFYKPLKNETITDRKRIVNGLQALREQFVRDKFPQKTSEYSLILGTWNLRDFDSDKFDFGPRENEAFYYIAEIISKFDVLAVQEINIDLFPLDKLMRVLGGSYEYILSDVTHSSIGGNRERLGFIYDRNKVDFKGIAGEIVLPDKMLIVNNKVQKRQFSRTPFGVEFQAGWFQFNFTTVHIYFGSNAKGSAKYKRRVGEIKAVAEYITEEAKGSSSNQILVGDFNIIEPGSKGHSALEEHGFKCVRNRKGSNSNQTRFYDQISYMSRNNELKVIGEPPDYDKEKTGDPDRVFQFFDSVYHEDHFKKYKKIMVKRLNEKIIEATKIIGQTNSQEEKDKQKKRIATKKKHLSSEAELKKYYKKWRTFQISDHLPLWVEIEIDFSDAYLAHLKEYKK